MALALSADASGHWTDACSNSPPAGLAAPAPRNTLVLIIDDLGYQWRNGVAMVELPGKVNLAVLPHTPHGARLAEAGFAAGKEIMLHAPMSNGGGMPLDQGGLTADMPRREFDEALTSALDAVPHVRGVNNHMGSELTQQPLQMGWLMQALLRRDLYFVDSRTTAATVAAGTATAYSVPNLSRTVFLDNQHTREAIGERFERLVSLAEKNGLAVGIGHPYPETAAFLQEAIPALRCRGIELAFVSEVVEGGDRRYVGPPRSTRYSRAGSGLLHVGADSGRDHVYDPNLEPDFYTTLSHVGLGLGNGVLAEVKDTGGQHSVGTPDENTLHQVIEVTHTP